MLQYLDVNFTSLLIQLISSQSNNKFYLGVVNIILFLESISIILLYYTDYIINIIRIMCAASI